MITRIPQTANTSQSNGVPADYTEQMEVVDVSSITPGTQTKLRLRPRVLNEHAESSREVMDIVDSLTAVGQTFKASQDNINGIYLTLESAEAKTAIDLIEEANDTALQAAWVLTGTNLAVLETTIISTNGGSTKSMKLMMDVADVWTYTKPAGSWDMTAATLEFDYYQTKETVKAAMTFSVSDGVNASVINISIPKVLKNTWQHFSLPITAFTGTANVAAITNVYFTVSLANGGEFAYVDNVEFRPQPGQIGIELWHHGNALPASNGTVDYTTGTQYTAIGDLGISGLSASQLVLTLKGGKQLYHIDDFIAGVAKEIPTNTLLTVGDYYSIVLKYIDTDVSVYGPNTEYSTDYYTNGYAWKAEIADNLIDKIPGGAGAGAYSDLMFGIFSTQDVYVTEMELRLKDSSGAEVDSHINTGVNFLIEDVSMGMKVLTNEHGISSKHSEGIGLRPILMEKGGKSEIYYNASVDDTVVTAIFELKYLFIPPTING